MRMFYISEIGLVSELPKKSLFWCLQICHTENHHRREELALNKEKWQWYSSLFDFKGAWHNPEESKNGDEQSHGPWKVKRQEKHELWGELIPDQSLHWENTQISFCVFSVTFFTQIYVRDICEILQHRSFMHQVSCHQVIMEDIDKQKKKEKQVGITERCISSINYLSSANQGSLNRVKFCIHYLSPVDQVKLNETKLFLIISLIKLNEITIYK